MGSSNLFSVKFSRLTSIVSARCGSYVRRRLVNLSQLALLRPSKTSGPRSYFMLNLFSRKMPAYRIQLPSFKAVCSWYELCALLEIICFFN